MKKYIALLATLAALFAPGHAARAVAGFGPLLSTPKTAIVPPLPGTPTLNLISTSGLTLGSTGSWVDTVSSYAFTIGGTTTNIASGTLNGITAPNWVSGSTTSYFEDSSITMGTILTASAWTIAVVAQYTGAVLCGGTSFESPSVFVDSDSYLGIMMCQVNGGDPTRIIASAYTYPEYAPITGPSGSLTQAHVVIGQYNSGYITTYLDGVAGTAVAGNATTTSYVPTVGYGENSETSFQGPIARIIVWNSGTVSPSAIRANLKAIYGTP